MTATEELNAILTEIITNPDEDTHRLVYADRLDERGEPGDGERAEFIRVQCELFNRGSECNSTGHACECCAGLKKRERFWLETNRKELQSKWDRSVIGLLRQGPMETPFPELYLSRGFVSHITCSSADWLKHADNLHWNSGQTVECPTECPTCGGFWANWKCGPCYRGRIPRPCPPTAQPLTEVTLTTEPHERDFGTIETFDHEKRIATYYRWKGIRFHLPRS